MRRYLVLFAVTLVVATGLVTLARAPRRTAAGGSSVTSQPVVDLALEITDGRLSPEAAAVPKDHRVRFTIENRGSRAVSIALAGYEDRVARAALAPGERWADAFTADRPGEDFAWLVNGEPAGRLAVQGSHLVEGHR